MRLYERAPVRPYLHNERYSCYTCYVADEQLHSEKTDDLSRAQDATAAPEPSEAHVVDNYAQEALSDLGSLSKLAVEFYQETLSSDGGKFDNKFKVAQDVLSRVGADRTEQLRRESNERAAQRDRIVFVLPERAVEHTERLVGRSFVQVESNDDDS